MQCFGVLTVYESSWQTRTVLRVPVCQNHKCLLSKVGKSYLKFSLFFPDVAKSERLWRMCLYKLTELTV